MVALAIGGVALRLGYVQRTLVIVDEFQHLHSAYLVSAGQTPYLDFFEHHPPLFYYLAAAVVPMASPSFDTIIQARNLALVFSGLTMGLACLWLRRLYGHTEALVAGALLLGNFFLFARGSLGYLDTFAAPFLVLSAMCLTWRERHTILSYAGCALALGVAILFTQKASMAAVAPIAVVLGRTKGESSVTGRCGVVTRGALGFALGTIAAAALLVGLLGPHAVGAFVQQTVTTNLGWQARRFPLRELLILGLTDGAIYGLAALGAGIGLRAIWRRGFVVSDRDVPILYCLALSAGVFILPVVWEEYFVLLVPFAVMVAAVTLVDMARRGARATLLPWWMTGALCALMAADLAGRRLAGEHPLSLTAITAVLFVWAGLGAALWGARRGPVLRRAVLGMALLLSLPLAEQVDWLDHNSNAEQRERLAYVLQTTASSDRVFDGYSGYGVFRPHAYRYWFLHEEMLLMLSDEEKGPQIVAALERERPPIAVVDEYVRALPTVVRDYIATHYVDTPFPDLKRRRS